MLGGPNSGWAALTERGGARVTGEDIEASYGTEPILHGLAVDLPVGSLTAVCGPNGSGKSTLLRVLARQHRPHGGAVLLDGRDLGEWSHRDLARELSFLPQSPLTPAGVSVREVVQQGRFPHRPLLGGLRAEDRAAVHWALRVTRATDLADRDIAELSGGERQRVWIALALAQRGRVLLLDEPTTFLDIRYQVDVLDLLRRLADEVRLTVAVVLHDLNHAAAVADHMVLISAGRVAACGPPAEVMTAGHIERVFGVQVSLVVDPDTGRPVCIPRRPGSPDAPRGGTDRAGSTSPTSLDELEE